MNYLSQDLQQLGVFNELGHMDFLDKCLSLLLNNGSHKLWGQN